MNNRWRLDGRKALITGGTRGIGRATAEQLLQLGAEVFIVARSERDVTAAVKSWNADGHSAFGLAADITVEADRREIFRQIENEWSRLDVLVNNVGTNV